MQSSSDLEVWALEKPDLERDSSIERFAHVLLADMAHRRPMESRRHTGRSLERVSFLWTEVERQTALAQLTTTTTARRANGRKSAADPGRKETVDGQVIGPKRLEEPDDSWMDQRDTDTQRWCLEQLQWLSREKQSTVWRDQRVPLPRQPIGRSS